MVRVRCPCKCQTASPYTPWQRNLLTMKIRTFDELSDSLTSELAWRKKELSDLKYFIEQNKSFLFRTQVLSRCGISILYAHWEGFVKLCGSNFLEYVAMQRHKNNKLKKNLLTLSMRNSVNLSENTKKSSEYEKITNFFLNKMDSRSSIPFKTAINTESNLSSKVFKEIVWCLGIDYSLFETKEKFIDSRLLGRRNHIAHGQKLNVNLNEYDEMRETLIEMMTNFKTQLENCAINKEYLTSGGQTSVTSGGQVCP